MNKMLVCALTVTLMAVGGSAFAQGKVWDDLSWWGKSGATPAPVKDNGSACPVEPRSGYWWWPTEPKSNADDSELWGNRGVVYAQYTEEAPPQTTAAPPETPKPIKKHVVPTDVTVLFDFDKAVLKPEGKAATDKIVAEMKKWPKDTAVLEGHTCDIGADAYNMGLGQRRADAVKNYMVEQGIDAKRLESKSYGETKPAVPNDSAANRKLNRRSVFVITGVD